MLLWTIWTGDGQQCRSSRRRGAETGSSQKNKYSGSDGQGLPRRMPAADEPAAGSQLPPAESMMGKAGRRFRYVGTAIDLFTIKDATPPMPPAAQSR